MTSIGEISAARITTPGAECAAPCGDFRRALTTSLTPRLRVLFFAAAKNQFQILKNYWVGVEVCSYLS